MQATQLFWSEVGLGLICSRVWQYKSTHWSPKTIHYFAIIELLLFVWCRKLWFLNMFLIANSRKSFHQSAFCPCAECSLQIRTCKANDWPQLPTVWPLPTRAPIRVMASHGLGPFRHNQCIQCKGEYREYHTQLKDLKSKKMDTRKQRNQKLEHCGILHGMALSRVHWRGNLPHGNVSVAPSAFSHVSLIPNNHKRKKRI